MPGTPHTCTRAQRDAGDTSQCFACQETHGFSTGTAPAGEPTPAAVRELLAAAGIARRAVEVRYQHDGPAVLVRVVNARASYTARRVFAALDATGYRIELPPANGLYLVHPAPAGDVDQADEDDDVMACGIFGHEPHETAPGTCGACGAHLGDCAGCALAEPAGHPYRSVVDMTPEAFAAAFPHAADEDQPPAHVSAECPAYREGDAVVPDDAASCNSCRPDGEGHILPSERERYEAPAAVDDMERMTGQAVDLRAPESVAAQRRALRAAGYRGPWVD